MQVILFRHGKAVSKEVAGSDENRWLTEEGKEQVARVAKCLPKPSAIFSSPLRRARETAEILSSIFGIEYEVLEELSPGRLKPETFSKIVKPGALYVAHNPDLENLIEHYGCKAELKAGGAAVLNLMPPKLVALLNPQFCR